MDEVQGHIPAAIGEFRILRLLSQGRHARVYLGESSDGGQVAVKVMDHDRARDRLARRRFAHSIDTARRVQGSGTATVIAADSDSALPWLATQYLPGPTLAQRVSEHGPLPEPQVLRLVADLALALASMHAVGVVHGKLEPTNVLLTAQGAKLIDVGAHRPLHGSAIDDPDVDDTAMGYLAPEQVTEDWVGPPADIFSLGSVAFFAATGHVAFGAGSAAQVVHRLVNDEPDVSSLKNPRLRGSVWDALAKEPSQRPSAADVAQFTRPDSADLPPALAFGAGVATAAALADTRAASRLTLASDASQAASAQAPGPADQTGPRRIRWLVPVVLGSLVVVQVGWTGWSSRGRAEPAATTTTATPTAPPRTAAGQPAPSPVTPTTTPVPLFPDVRPPASSGQVAPLPAPLLPGIPLPLVPAPASSAPAPNRPAPAARTPAPARSTTPAPSATATGETSPLTRTDPPPTRPTVSPTSLPSVSPGPSPSSAEGSIAPSPSSAPDGPVPAG